MAPSSDASPIVLVLPLGANRGNARGHSRWASAARLKEWDGYDKLYQAGLLPEPPTTPLPYVRIHYDVVVKAPNDWDNLLARQKNAQDYCARGPKDRSGASVGGWILNDSPREIPYCPTITQRVSRSERSTVTITITPIPRPVEVPKVKAKQRKPRAS